MSEWADLAEDLSRELKAFCRDNDVTMTEVAQMAAIIAQYEDGRDVASMAIYNAMHSGEMAN